MLPSLSTHPLASSVQEKSLLGAGGVFLSKGKRELEAPTRGEAVMRWEAAAGALSGRGGATRGNATTSRGKWEGGATRSDMTTKQHVERQWHIKRLLRDKKPRDNQPGEWETKAHWKVAALAKASAEQWQRWVRHQSTKKWQQLWQKRQWWWLRHMRKRWWG